MIKSYFFLLLIFLHRSSVNAGEEDNRHEPVIRFTTVLAEAVKTFSFDDKQLNEDKSVIQNYLCSPETDEDVLNMEEASKNNYKLKYCLFIKKFQKDEDRICRNEAKPVLIEMVDEETSSTQCGFKQDHTIHGLSYYDCGGLAVLKKFRDKSVQKDPTSYKFKPKLKYPYKMCYNTVGKSVLWTKHEIQTPQLFQNPYLKNQRELPETEISTDSFFMDPDLFLILKRRYEDEKFKNKSQPGTFVMVPRPLVPAEHHAIHMLKKTTHHYINMAPLWEKLVPLMTAIDQGIKQAQLNLESRDPKSYNHIYIHTRVTTSKEVDTTSKTWFNLLLFQGNIWYKFIHRSGIQSAVLIIIHNTPGNPPSTGCLIGEQKECNFRTWSKDEEIRQLIDSDDTKYAYCCKVDAFFIKSIFAYDYQIGEYLDIDSLISEDEGIVSK